MNAKLLKTITQTLLLSVIAIIPFFKIDSLYFPFVSGRVYLFRVLLMLAFFFWAWLFFKEKKYQPNFKNILVLFLILFFLAQIFVSLFSVDPVFSFFSGLARHEGVMQYGFWLLYFLLLISVFKKERDWQTFFSVFIIVAFFLCLSVWLEFPFERAQYGNFFGNPAYLSGFLLFAIGFCLIMFERKFFDKKTLNYLLLGLAGFFGLTVFFNQIRGPLIGLIGGIFLFCFLSILFLRGESKKLVFSCLAILLISLSSIVLLFAARETEFVKNSPALSRITKIINIREAGSPRERLLVWQIALKAFQEKPVFGYGPENFASAVNRHYDYRLGETEPWFDRAHSNLLEVLATGGLVLFVFYLFWLSAVFYLIFKIAGQNKVLSFLLASLFFAYFLQGIFWFDSFAVFLGLFPFLAFVALRQKLITTDEKLITADAISVNQLKSAVTSVNTQLKSAAISAKEYVLIPVALLSLLVVYMTVLVPWKANNAAWQFFNLTEAGFYKEAKLALEKSFAVNSFYTYWPVRKEAGWQFLSVLEDQVSEATTDKDIRTIQSLYDFIVPEMERFVVNNPHEPQMYYVLARTYRAGFEKLGRTNDLAKAETVLKKGIEYSNLRKEYFEELKIVLLEQGKFKEAEKILQDYAKRVDFYDYFSYLFLGHFYFEAEKYELALDHYEKAKDADYDFCQVPAEYSRYMFSAEQIKEYEKVVALAKNCLEKWGPGADAYFNISVGYLNLGEKEKAREFFLKAVELDSEYEKYKIFFEN